MKFRPSKSNSKAVKHATPKPDKCRYCQSFVHIVNNEVVYGRSVGRWPWVYLCKDCGAYVGMHPHTDIPLGSLANSQLRTARKRAKNIFRQLYEKLDVPRGKAYKLLKDEMNIAPERCHFGMFELDECKRAEIASMKLVQLYRQKRLAGIVGD